MFEDDARVASRELDLTLTTRDHAKGKSAEEKTPMCGVPYHSSESYIARLVAKGYKVAICEQMEDPALAKGLVKRDVIRIVTPGSVTESSMLTESQNNYYACLFTEDGVCGLAFCDVSTGAFHVTQTSGEDWAKPPATNSGAFCPPRLCSAARPQANPSMRCSASGSAPASTAAPMRGFDLARCAAALDAQFGAQESLEPMPCAIRAAGALLETLKNLQKNDLPHIRQLDLYMAGRFMGLDLAARRIWS